MAHGSIKYEIVADSMTLPRNKIVRKGDLVSEIHFQKDLIEGHIKNNHIKLAV